MSGLFNSGKIRLTFLPYGGKLPCLLFQLLAGLYCTFQVKSGFLSIPGQGYAYFKIRCKTINKTLGSKPQMP